MRINFNLLLLFTCCALSAAQNRNGRNQQCDALTIQRPNNQNVCITNRAIDTAFQSAQGTRPLTVGAATDVLGLALVQTTSALTRQFTLTRPEIENQLPTINTAPTAIRRFCPARLLQPRCTAQRFRTMDGSCNNLNNAHFGATDSPTTRLLPASYGDGLSTARVSASGAALPNVRQISTLTHQDTGKPDPSTGATLFFPAFGQTLGHDFNNVALTGGNACCQNAAANRPNPACGTIIYPANDPFFSQFRQTCAEFPLASSGVRAGCRLGSKIPFNSATTFIDASFVYGNDDATARNLRTRTNGLLRTDPAPRGPGLKELLPRNPADSLTLTGDFRSSQTPLLIVIHTLFLREHNRIARELFRINPHWNDEQIYQETRRIIGAYVQHITYGEFLPIVLGQNLMNQYQLNLQRQGFTNVYNGALDPSLPVEFHAAAFRFGHSLIPPRLERWSVDHSRVVASEQLRNLFNRPFNDQGGVLDQYMAGFLNQRTHAVDGAITQELTNHVLQAAGSTFGDDLASRNMARGRDEGLPGYNAYRRLCGQSAARDWNDLANVFQAPKTLQAYRQLYASVDDIDLWSAGISERHAPGAQVGQVFGCIIGLTFQRLKRGDRFWYENSGQPSSFTQGQLDEIRKVSFSRMICDNSENIQTVQRNAFRVASQNLNPRVPCTSIPRINLELWRENRQQQTNTVVTSRPGTGTQIRPNRLGGRTSRTDFYRDVYRPYK